MNHPLLQIKKDCSLTDRDVIGDLCQPMDSGQEFLEGDNNYVWFYLIGQFYKPKKIIETGTRFGYSLKAFVTGAGHSPKEYSLWVYDDQRDGFQPLPVFEYYFKTKLNIQDIHINCIDTETITSFDVPYDVDFCMVDARHTEPGCYNECKMAYEKLKPGGVIVVDDTLVPDVRAGAERFCQEMNLTFDYFPSLRGIHLIHKPEV